METVAALKNYLKASWSSLFRFGQRLGVDILPRHFYSEIPDIAKLKATEQWRKPYSLIGVNGSGIDQQLQFVRSTVTPELAQRFARDDVYRSACERNGEAGYGPVEAGLLYAFIATHQPRQIMQVGCGVSTAICLAAAHDSGYRPRLTCIDPLPTRFLRQAADEQEISLIAQPVESLDPDVVSALADGDLFFVDSTHTLGPAGEVGRIILEFLPRLTAGTHVHFHDIYFPYDYPDDVLTRALFFPHESVLLHGFLVHNARFAIQASMSMLHHQRSSEMVALLPYYKPRETQDGLAIGPGHFPSAIYLRVLHAPDE
jgi:predicted O-methyltransferase YrrM